MPRRCSGHGKVEMDSKPADQKEAYMTDDKRIAREIDDAELDEVAGGVGRVADSPLRVYELKCRNCGCVWRESFAVTSAIAAIMTGAPSSHSDTCLRCGGEADVLRRYYEMP